MSEAAKPVRIVIVGVGRMGQHHARVYAQTPGFELVAVCDAKPANAQKISEMYKVPSFPHVRDMLAAGLKPDAAVVAVPTVYHREMAEILLRAGCDVLVEKPLAPNAQDAAAIVEAARANQRILQVGHSERFNPAVVALRQYELKPQFVEVHRISPMTFRSLDVGVVLDMMIHDIDIVHSLVRCPATDVTAVGVGVVGKFEDIANARITFANGCVANLTASRLALKTERKMRLFSPAAYVSVDYQKKSGVVITKTANEETIARVREQVRTSQITDLTQLNYPELVKYEELAVADREPLRAQAEDFLRAIRTRQAPQVTGDDGLAAVDIATRIAASIASHQWSDVPDILRQR